MADPLGQEPGLEDADGVIVPISSGRRLQIVATTRYRAIKAVWFGACVVDVLVGLRFLLELLGASSRSEFVSLVYMISAPLVEPFRGIFPNAGKGVFVLEPAALVALAIYPLLAAGIVGLIRILASRRRRQLF
jgi:YggT family protein